MKNWKIVTTEIYRNKLLGHRCDYVNKLTGEIYLKWHGCGRKDNRWCCGNCGTYAPQAMSDVADLAGCKDYK